MDVSRRHLGEVEMGVRVEVDVDVDVDVEYGEKKKKRCGESGGLSYMTATQTTIAESRFF
jgi:hypothetical protein